MKNEVVVVTGAGGFLGSHIAERFLADGVTVIGIDNFCTGLQSNFEDLKHQYGPKFVTRVADVIQPWEALSLSQLIPKDHKIKYVFHFASPASPPVYQRLWKETLQVNSVGLENALTFADQYQARLIFASTSEIYGDPEVHPQPEDYRGSVSTTGPRACYDEAKRYGEALISTWNRNLKTNHGFVRIFNTYGPRMNPADGRVVINFMTQAKQDLPLTIYGDGKQTRSFCYVDDLVSGICTYAKSNETQPINIGNDKEYTILELAQAVKEIYKKSNLKITHEGLPADDPKLRRPNLSLSVKALPDWQGPTVPLVEGLGKLKAWLETEGML